MSATPPQTVTDEHAQPQHTSIVIEQPNGSSQQRQQQIDWIPVPHSIMVCPPGLEYLNQVDNLMVQQIVDGFEEAINNQTKNRYKIKNSLGLQLYFAQEENDACMRQWCVAARGFTIHITDNASQEVIRIVRDFRCCANCCCAGFCFMENWCAYLNCCGMEVLIEAPVGQLIGYVCHKGSLWKPSYSILDDNRKCIFEIEGPCCRCQCVFCCCACTEDQEFKLYSQGTKGNAEFEMGKISKQWEGAAFEIYTKATNFNISFSKNLNLKEKILFLAATFLIDFMFYEWQNNRSMGMNLL